jgi:nitrate/nitrite transporter NarK
MLGIITSVGNMGGFITPLIVGTIEKKTGSLKGGLLFFGVIGFLLAILPFFLQETGPKARRP